MAQQKADAPAYIIFRDASGSIAHGFFDAFSSTDLVTWTKHPRILDTTRVTWANRAVWAPTVVKKGDWYYIVFGANDIQNDQQKGGLGIARSKSPSGPFEDVLGKPLVDAFHNGAQPIDPTNYLAGL